MAQTPRINSYDIISNIAFITQLAPAILYLIFRKRIKDKLLRVIALLTCLSFASDAISTYFSNRNFTTFSVVNVFVLLETLGLLYFFYQAISQKIFRGIIALFTLAFLVVWVVDFIKIGTKNYMETNIAMESIAIIASSVYYFFEQVREQENFLIYLKPRFWAFLGYLLYTVGTFFLFLLMDSLNKDDKEKLFILNSIFTILKTACLSIAMCMKNYNKRRKFEIS